PELRPLVPCLVDPARAHAAVARDALPVVQHAEPSPGDPARFRRPAALARTRYRRLGLPRQRPTGIGLRDPARHPGDLPLPAPRQLAPGGARREQSQQAAFGSIEEVDRAIGPLAHVADPHADLAEQAFGFAQAVLVAFEADQPLAGKRADEQVAAPGAPLAAGHEGHARGCNRRGPLPQGRFDTGRRGAFADPGAARVFPPMADPRPAVIAPGKYAVDLVAATRAVLVDPERARFGVDRGALNVAMAIGPDFRQRAAAGGEGVVARHAAIGPQAHDLADVARQVGGLVAQVVAIAEGRE